MAHFLREKALAERLMNCLGNFVYHYLDPNEEAARETGIDVIVVVHGRRIGLQVTEIDTGEVAGRARRQEKQIARTAMKPEACTGGVYGAWVESDPNKLVQSVARSISRKVEISKRHDFVNLDEVWLLLCCGIPENGAVASTFIITFGLEVKELDTATLDQLSESKYDRAFLLPIVGPEKALYCWAPRGSWQKLSIRTAR
jgi:hypothetical protein